MHITQLRVQNFKGITAEYGLNPVTIITGANFAHKTTIPLAIRLALAGYLPPPIGVKGIYQLAGNPKGAGQMGISLEMDNSRFVQWTWKKDARGKVSTEGGLSSDIAMPELLLEPELFFGKTGAEQVQTIFEVCKVKPEECTPQMLSAQLGKINASPLEFCEETVKELRATLERVPTGTAPQLWIAQFLDWLKAEGKNASDDARGAEGAFQAFRAGPEPTGVLADVSAELAQARETLFKFQNHNNLASLKSTREQLLERRKAYPPMASINATLQKYDSILAAPPLELPPDADIINESIDELTADTGMLEKSLAPLPGLIEAKKAQIAQLEESRECPMCGSHKKGWQSTKIANLTTELSTLIRQRDRETLDLGKVRASLVDVKAYMDAIIARPGSARQKAELQGLQDMLAKVDESIEEAEKNLVDNGPQIQAAQQAVADLEKRQEAWTVYQSDRGRRVELEKRLVRARCRVEVFKQAYKLATAQQAELIDKAVKVVLNVARYFTDGLLNSALEYIEGELGRRVSNNDSRQGNIAPVGSWIPFASFSGTERLLALAGFGVALCTQAPLKLVVLDEMGRMDGQRAIDTALRLASLIPQVIDQAILVDVDPKRYQSILKRPGIGLLAV